MENYLLKSDTLVKVFMPLITVVVMVYIFRFRSLNTKIKDALRSLLDFILVGPGVRSSFTEEYITQLENIKQHVIEKVEESDKKEYFEWSTEVLLAKPEAMKYVISSYENYVSKESERIGKQKKEKEGKNEPRSDLEKGQEVRKELFKRFGTLSEVYYTQRRHKSLLKNRLIPVIILDISIIALSVFVYPSSVLPLKINLTSMLVPLALLSIIAFIFSVLFILIYLL